MTFVHTMLTSQTQFCLTGRVDELELELYLKEEDEDRDKSRCYLTPSREGFRIFPLKGPVLWWSWWWRFLNLNRGFGFNVLIVPIAFVACIHIIDVAFKIVIDDSLTVVFTKRIDRLTGWFCC